MTQYCSLPFAHSSRMGRLHNETLTIRIPFPQTIPLQSLSNTKRERAICRLGKHLQTIRMHKAHTR